MARRFESFGVSFSIEIGQGVPDGAWMDALPPDVRASRKAPTRRYAIERVDSGYRLRTKDESCDEIDVYPDARSTLDAIEGSLGLHIAAIAPAHIFVHAGVVAWRGRAILLPGRSMSGKSTLVAQLLAAGALYYSDEFAVLDANGAVHAYARRMSLRRRVGLPRRVLPNRRGRRALRVGWVVATQFERGRRGISLEALTPGRTALLLLDNTVSARVAPARVLPVLRSVAGRAQGASGVRGEARQAVKALLAHCQADRRVVPKLRREEV